MDKTEIIENLIADVIGKEGPVEKEEIQVTINNILRDYNLSTDMSFVEKMASINFGSDSSGKKEMMSLTDVPEELKDAAFLPVNTIADITLKQDLDLVISQIPEWFTAVQVTRDMICESDIVTGKLARTISFDETKIEDNPLEKEHIISKVEDVEERLELHQLIKNHMVTGTLEYGENAMYAIPYAKVFEDLYKYRLSNENTTNGERVMGSMAGMFDTSSVLHGYGYHEQAIELSLKDTIIAEQAEIAALEEANRPKGPKSDYKRSELGAGIFTEQEIMEVYPMYHAKPMTENMTKEQAEVAVQSQKEHDREIDKIITELSENIRYINADIALPVVEQSAFDLKAVYETKYADKAAEGDSTIMEGYIPNVESFFEKIMMEDHHDIMPQFAKVKGIYLKPLPATKLIPIRIDRCVVGYYYYSDMTRPEQAGERKNSGLSGYSLRSPSVGYDTFSPDKMLCEKLANKIIKNFDLKFMRDNTALHEQIVAILQAHNFNNSMMRLIFIPAEYVIMSSINKDGSGKGHSMLEPGLVTARMYMFLKLYSLLYQINNSQIRVYNLHTSGIDQNHRKMVQDTIRKFSSRRITANDIFNYRSSMVKVSGGSEMVMLLGPNDKPPVTIDSIEGAQSPLNSDFLDSIKNEAINSTPVPSALVQGAMSELEFAKEVELANTRMKSTISSYKMELNPDITRLYRRILRWETDIDPAIINTLTFAFRMTAAKELSVTSDMVSSFNTIRELAIQNFLTAEEQKPEDKDNSDASSVIVREYTKLLITEYFPTIDVDRLEELADMARHKANVITLDNKTSETSNLLADQAKKEEEEEL